MPRQDCPMSGTAQVCPALPSREGPVPKLLLHTQQWCIPKPLRSHPLCPALAGYSQLLQSPDFESS